MSLITQEYFDQLVEENVEVFDLTQEEALHETLQQLALSGVPTDHLLLSKNDDKERQERLEFSTSLEYLRSLVASVALKDPDAADLPELQRHLDTVHSYLCIDFEAYSTLLLGSDGFSTYLRLLQHQQLSVDDEVLRTLTYVLSKTLAPEKLKLFQKGFSPTVMQAWMRLFGAQPRESLLLLAYWSCKRCDTNKQLWMEQRMDNTSLVDLLVSSLVGTVPPLLVPVCRCITVLCRNDFEDTEAPLTASATSRVQQFTTSGQLVGALHCHLRNSSNDNTNDHADVVVALLQTCRALAIHNDVVVAMREEGLVESTIAIFEASTLSDVGVTTACLALFRNLCANDDLQDLLGTRILPTLAARFAQAVQETPDLSLLEQASGLVAALALRHGANARKMVEEQVPAALVAAMQLYPTAASLQRSAAFAIRNLASRLSVNDENNESTKQELQQLCKPVLLDAASAHADCQEAVYAALRDLGCSAQMNKVVVDQQGRTRLVQGTAVFEPGSNAGFRAVYD